MVTHIGGDPLGIPENWTFNDAKIAKGFDRHVREQLPWYDFASDIASHVAKAYLPVGGKCYDLGCGTGNMGLRLAQAVVDRKVEMIGVDQSPAMLGANENLMNGVYRRVIAERVENLLMDPCDVAISFLTLMFVPVSARKRLIESVMHHLRPGGAFILCEKMTNGDPYLNTVFARINWGMKMEATQPADIVAKELSLNGIQRPIGYDELPANAVPFFQCGDFRGWVCPK